MTELAPTPIQNLDAEESVLGAIMMSPAALLVAEEILEPGHFYRPSHGLIFATASSLSERGEAVDAITLAAELERRGKLKQAGGKEKIHELAALVPATSNVAHYANIVREHSGIRLLSRAGAEISRLSKDRGGTLEELVAQAELALTEAIKPSIITQFATAEDDFHELGSQIRDAYKSGEPMMGLKTGYFDLDTTLTGLHPGTLIYIAARPGMGKSALMLNIAENVVDAGGVAAILSHEMSKRELLIRQLARACKIDSTRLRTGQLKAAEIPRYKTGWAKVKSRLPSIPIEDSPGVTTTQLRAEIRRLHRQHNLDILFVDYIQLMISGGSEENRQAETAAISRSLKLLARELNIPIVVLSQLNRKLEGRPDKRPALSDLRDSGALEQDADVVLFIYRDDYYNPDTDATGVAEIIVAKNRMGPQKTEKLTFSARHSSFNNLPTQGATSNA